MNFESKMRGVQRGAGDVAPAHATIKLLDVDLHHVQNTRSLNVFGFAFNVENV